MAPARNIPMSLLGLIGCGDVAQGVEMPSRHLALSWRSSASSPSDQERRWSTGTGSLAGDFAEDPA
jgi:hypothetical protein